MWEERGDRCDRWWGESGESDESYKTDKSDENGESNKSGESGDSNKSGESAVRWPMTYRIFFLFSMSTTLLIQYESTTLLIQI